MDIVQKKPPRQYTEELKRLIKLFTYKNNKLELKGSASLSSQQYFSDYDLFCILVDADKSEFYKFISELITKQIPDLWFIELKLQTKSKKKVRIYPPEKLEKSDMDAVWDNLDIIKADFVARIDGYFTEISVIYSFQKEPPTTEDYIRSLQEDIKELRKERKYYKMLKRQFNIHKARDEKSDMLRLSKVFNSDLGREYQLISRLEAMKLVLEHYQQDDVLKRKLKIALKDLKVPAGSSIEGLIASRSKELNTTAKKFL
jgi:hypothetical protein